MDTRSLPFRRLAPLALALACAIAAPAMAADKDDAAQRKELDQARKELQAAAARVAELSRELQLDGDALRFVIDGAGVSAKPRLGVLLGVDEQSGVRIAGVTPGGGADKAGLKSGDRLLRIGGKAIAGSNGEARV